jgi:hypothetical protein
MALFSTTQTFTNIVGKRLVSIDANGGSVVIAVEHTPGTWVDNETLTEDDVVEVDFDVRMPVRFTPSGGATYSFKVNL